MKIVVLQSGSSGNCTYVESGPVRLLFDAGISGRQARLRLDSCSCCVNEVDALIISHDHRDHVRSMGVFHRKFGLPVHITQKTLQATQAKDPLGKINDIHYFQSGACLQFGKVVVETIPTPHDSADGVAFVIDDGKSRFGIFTDLGHVFDQLVSTINTLDAVLIESNYDPDLLEQGPYPLFLKQRIRGPHGHISNVESAELLQQTSHGNLRWACLAHLSAINNSPERALATHRDILGNRVPLTVASRNQVSELLEV